MLLWACRTFALPPTVCVALVPIGALVCPLSLLIGHFICEPLADLQRQASACLHGADVEFTGSDTLYEANELAGDFSKMVQKAKASQHELEVREQRRSAFISDVAHELKTPLTAIRGNAEMLSDPDLPPELHEKFCNIIVAESERLSRLTRDLLDLQRLDNDVVPLNLKRVNLRTLSMGVVNTLEPILSAAHAQVEVVGEAPDVLGDEDKLRQAITNLVENASRFIEPGGHISIELFGLQGNAVLAVKDDGCGFGDIDPQLLFDRFYRTDFSRSRNKGGSGLGLAIVKSIVDIHDGSIEALNLPGGGACFIVALPAVGAAE